MLKPLLAAGLVAATLGQAHAAVFTDRAAFEGAISVSYTETFESLPAGTNAITGPITMPTGLVVSSPSNRLFSAGAGQSSNPTEAIGSDSPIEDSLNFALGGAYFAFGGDFFQNFGGGSQGARGIDYALSFFNAGNLVDSITSVVAPDGGSFIGYVGASAFDSVQVLALTSAFEVADNITVGSAANPIPEPASLALAGVGVVALLSRRKARSA